MTIKVASAPRALRPEQLQRYETSMLNATHNDKVLAIDMKHPKDYL